MTKDPDIRITDTIAFIRTAMVPTQSLPHRGLVADMLEERERAGEIFTQDVSPAMSQGHNFAVFHRDQVKTERHYRRAIILIRMIFQSANAKNAADETAQVSDANLPMTLGTYLDQVIATRDDLISKLTLLKADPLTFLTNNKLDVIGAPTSGLMSFWFLYEGFTGVYRFAPERGGDWVRVKADLYNLHVVQYKGLTKNNLPQGGREIIVPGNVIGGADLMVTTQLTGCSVVYFLQGAMLVAAHVQPIGTTGLALCRDLRAEARLVNAPNGAVTGVFGVDAGGNPHDYQVTQGLIYCIGVMSGGWDLFAQQRMIDGPPTRAWQIT